MIKGLVNIDLLTDMEEIEFYFLKNYKFPNSNKNIKMVNLKFK